MDKNFLLNALLQKSKLRWFIIEIGGEGRMNIYPEFKKIAMMNAKIERLVKALEEKLDMDGLDVRAARLIHVWNRRDVE